jgi:hypothetical protein
MSANNKKSVAAETMTELEEIKRTIKEESKSTIQNLLQEAVKDYMRDAIDGEDEDEDDVEIQDDEKEPADDESEKDEKSTDAESENEFPAATDFEDVESGEDDEDKDKEDTEAPSAEDDAQEGDEWAEFDKYKVDDDTYDLTGEKDYDSVVKVYKLLKDEDNVVVKKDGDKLTLKDGANDAEYVIDLGTEDEDGELDAEVDIDECGGACALKEEDGSQFAGIPNNENRKNRKTMKENKEKIFEIDLGYTDNYQKEDPIEGLSNAEPGKGKDWDKGLPKGTEKPWAGKGTEKAGDPYKEAVNEQGEEGITDIVDGEKPSEAPVEEATNVGGAVQERGAGKSHIPAGREEYVPDGSRHLSAGGDYKEVKLAESILSKSEAILKENKELRATLSKVKSALQEALMVNVNLGKVTKLFLENTTTQNEKVDIINRFNEAKTIDQSNALYESIKRELQKENKQNVMLEEKSMDVRGSAINENKIYESQDLLSMKDLIKRMANC